MMPNTFFWRLFYERASEHMCAGAHKLGGAKEETEQGAPPMALSQAKADP